MSAIVAERDDPATWDEYHRRISSIAAEMIGAAGYLAAHPDYATDERVAAKFYRYAERMSAVQVPS